MFYMYILKSLKDDKLYIGYTGNLKRRFSEHNGGLVQSTRTRKPFKLIYYEAYNNAQEAKRREGNLKLRAKALRQLLIRIEKSVNS
ncbi:MAG: GIY-YIG nuclease family protein [Patescibacteria group bacterium]